ncbi:MAG TPA: M28 family metallopeptidase [Rhizomicrobium sp.]|nr:M28 family metallopeptidase [Rhizomicrobium sp.]
MTTRIFSLLACLLLLGGTAFAQPDRSAENIKAHMAFLASDKLKGREAGTPEYDQAADYVAAQMKQLGLKPLGDAKGSYFQRVPLLASRPKDQGVLVLRDAAGKETPLVFGKDYLPGSSPLSPALKMDAPMVFVGYGLVAPEHGRDDYRGLDVKGKIVVALAGAPKFLQTEERAYYRSARPRLTEAQARGAIGYLSVSTLTGEKLYPFPNRVRQYRSWGMTWRDKDGAPFVAIKLPVVGGVSVAGAQKLFGAQTAKILAAAETKQGVVRGFAMPFHLRAVLNTEIKTAESKNVVGLLEGSDPKLKDEYVVLSAHLDHIGITPPVKGDVINNGALDNASGVSTTLEVARLFRDGGVRPKRSALFLLVTAEEKGLIGAEYFARNPGVPLSAIVADVDLDMPILTYDFTDVVAFGADRSSIGPSVRRAAARMNVKLSPDPMPDEGIFTRSDHYRFVEQGIPAVFLATGYANGGEAAHKVFMAQHYHKPSDDLSQPIRYDTAAKFARLNFAITRELTDGPRPSWNKNDFFADKFVKRK